MECLWPLSRLTFLRVPAAVIPAAAVVAIAGLRGRGRRRDLGGRLRQAEADHQGPQESHGEYCRGRGHGH